MAIDDDKTPLRNNRHGDLSLDDRLDRLEAMNSSLSTKLDQLLEKFSKFSGLEDRVKKLEVVVFGACGLILVAVFTALIAIVVKTKGG